MGNPVDVVFNAVEVVEAEFGKEHNTQLSERPQRLLNLIIDNHYSLHGVSQDRLEIVEKMRQKLQDEIRRDPNFGEYGRVDMFGSLANGFGTNTSDLDLCLRLKEDELDCMNNESSAKSIVEAMMEPLKTIGCTNVIPIYGARVPIVKFEWNLDGSKIDGDLSYYNILALYNTQLIKKYCEWEPKRLPKLGLFIKQWAKSCDIGSSALGSLSSYAYNLMLIYYLQNTEPPVLPNLQQDSKVNELHVQMVENVNVYFNKTVTNGWSKNTSSVAELLIGFFSFYSEFPEEKVIQINGTFNRPDTNKLIRIKVMNPFTKECPGKTAMPKRATFIKRAMSSTLRVLTVDFAEKFSADLEECESARLTSIEEELMKMCQEESVKKVPSKKKPANDGHFQKKGHHSSSSIETSESQAEPKNEEGEVKSNTQPETLDTTNLL